jgi:hypothetical protein
MLDRFEAYLLNIGHIREKHVSSYLKGVSDCYGFLLSQEEKDKDHDLKENRYPWEWLEEAMRKTLRLRQR